MTASPIPPNFPDTPLPRSEVRIAVVGCGKWGKNLVRNFDLLGALVAVCDQDPDIGKSMAEQYPHIKVTNDFDAILSDPDIDAVVVSTPTRTHYPLGKRVLEAKKHLYVEKPAATKVSEIQELFRLAEWGERQLMVGHLLLYHPAVNRLKQLIAEGVLGQITYIQSDRLNTNPYRNDLSVMWDLAPHDLSMCAYVLGEDPEQVVSVNGHRTSSDGLVDVAHIEMTFPKGISGHIHTSWVHPTKQVRLLVRGTLKSAVLDDALQEGKLQLFGKDESDTAIQEFPEYLTIEPLKLECQHFINCILSGRPPKTDGFNAYKVVEILEEADRRLNQVVPMPSKLQANMASGGEN